MSSRLKPIAAAALLTTTIACNQNQSPVQPAEPGPLGSSDSTVQSRPSDLPGAARHTYRVTLENLTTGQPFSPGVIATHTNRVSVFRVGDRALEGIRLIAENGDPSPAVADVAGAAGVLAAQAVPSPTHRIGGPGSNTQVVEIDAAANANRLSLAVMLICTNDGFTGLDSVKLPGGFKPETHLAAGYDAGTETTSSSPISSIPAASSVPSRSPPMGTTSVCRSSESSLTLRTSGGAGTSCHRCTAGRIPSRASRSSG